MTEESVKTLFRIIILVSLLRIIEIYTTSERHQKFFEIQDLFRFRC